MNMRTRFGALSHRILNQDIRDAWLGKLVYRHILIPSVNELLFFLSVVVPVWVVISKVLFYLVH